MMFTLGEIRNLEGSLTKIMDKDVPVKTAYKVSKFLKRISEELRAIEERRVALVKKYSRGEDEKGNFKVVPEKEIYFRKEFAELLQTEVDIDVLPVPLNDFGDIALSPIDLMKLEKIVIVDESIGSFNKE
jgi:hypothetical protein